MSPGDKRPVPDPTRLTTAALLHEIATLKELIEDRIEGEAKLNLERFAARDAALATFAAESRKERQQLHDSMAAASSVLSTAAKESDLRYQQRFEAQTKAVEAAFEANKKLTDGVVNCSRESAAKVEASMDRRIDAVDRLLNQRIDALQAVVARIETFANVSTGEKSAVKAGRDNTAVLWGILIAAAGVVVAVAGIGVALALKH